MKLTLLFLSVCVAISHQQYYRSHMIVSNPWLLPPFARQPMFFNNYMDHYPYAGGVNNIQARVKGYETLPQDLFDTQDENGENRFLFNSGSSTSIGNPLLKTVTFTITSTCTALSVTTCVVMSNLSPNPVACAGRRRRFIEYNNEQGDGVETEYPEHLLSNIEAQYPIVPSPIKIVMPTAEPSTGLARNSHDSPFGISSSMKDDVEANGFVSKDRKLRGKRFFNWNAFATGVTITTWSVISSTLTSTLAIPGVSTVLPCLPAGYGICQIAVGK
ncbi:Uncharacterized protein APZ42_020079 [Daphnia magna]|uniref:Uncharacterized protein n=1 Tax=Daphnia magna TaxID=35525 RepID=A0A162CMW6_9CRUS|nr:Uncharacterized protein APZ42_020079 [Daphnia magna]